MWSFMNTGTDASGSAAATAVTNEALGLLLRAAPDCAPRALITTGSSSTVAPCAPVVSTSAEAASRLVSITGWLDSASVATSVVTTLASIRGGHADGRGDLGAPREGGVVELVIHVEAGRVAAGRSRAQRGHESGAGGRAGERAGGRAPWRAMAGLPRSGARAGEQSGTAAGHLAVGTGGT